MVGLWRRKPAAPEEPVELAPMPSIFERPAAPPAALFSPSLLIPPLWQVAGADGAAIAGPVRFLPDGSVVGAPGTGVARWELLDGTLVVQADGQTLWVFDRRETRGRREIVVGRSPLVEGEIELRPDLDDLQTAHCLRWPSRPLLVVFNSVANPFDGVGTQWEFEAFLENEDLDFVLFSERSDPSFGYLNKTARVLDRLRFLPALGYQEFVFLGQGTGGFAAMMFAELLSYDFHQCRLRSLTINPVTAHGAAIEEALRGAAEPSMMPPLLDANVVSQKDCPVASIRDLVRMSTRRREGELAHRVLYDDGNPAQVFYVHPLDDLEGFTLCPVTLGLPHEAGNAAILTSPAFAEGLAWGRER